ncbi:hypothetical protein OAO18_04165 [Francisellaceae bacterium]|nr:hypothetical protein [Francisellaceae bacterium]
MLKKLKYLLIACVLMVSACTTMQPIDNIGQQTVPSGLTADQVRQSILSACGIMGYRADDSNSGNVLVTMSGGDQQTAVVKVTYDNSGYSLLYVSSQNIEQQNGQIAEAYNDWVKSLNNAIQKQLNQASSRTVVGEPADTSNNTTEMSKKMQQQKAGS